MKRVAVISGVRTPMVKSGGTFAGLSADDLGTIVARHLVVKYGFDFDEVIFGCVSQPYNAQNIARVIALKAGIPEKVPALTVHRNCASGLSAVTTASAKIKSGEIDIALVGGTESMSNYPLICNKEMTAVLTELSRARSIGQKLKVISKLRPKHLAPIIGLKEGLTDPVHRILMGETAEILARRFGVTKEEQDEFALMSHLKAGTAENVLGKETIPVFVPPKYEAQLTDDCVRRGSRAERIRTMKPFFDKRNGTVTIGNSCGITDGACALILASDEKVKELGVKPLGYIRDYAYAGLDPKQMGLGPVYSTAKLLKRTKVSFDAFDTVEINEAFASQIIACQKAFQSEEFCQEEFGMSAIVDSSYDWKKLNPNGGAIALGHPVGMTGARLVLTVLKEMENNDKYSLGLATLCIGGGQGGAIMLENQ
jgi:acetyl-CoA C-acetyltransferase/acetyl-CoA acyltransferase